MKVFIHGKFMAASAAKHCFLTEFPFRPDFVRAAADGTVAFKARKVIAAAIKFYGNPVDLRMVMCATRFAVDVQSYDGFSMSHGNPPLCVGLK